MILVAMESILVGYCEVLSYQNVCSYKLGWHSINMLDIVLSCITLERAAHQLSNKVSGICIAVVFRKIWSGM